MYLDSAIVIKLVVHEPDSLLCLIRTPNVFSIKARSPIAPSGNIRSGPWRG